MADSTITFTSREVSTYYLARVPDLKQRRVAEWRGACPIHHGKKDNFAVEAATGRWYCHSACGRGGDILELELALIGGSFPTRKAEVFRLVAREADYGYNGTCTNGNSADNEPTKPTDTWREIARYPYVDRDGSLLFEVIRYLKPDGTKIFIPVRPSGVEASGTTDPHLNVPLGGIVVGWTRTSTFSIHRQGAKAEDRHGGKPRAIHIMTAWNSTSAIARAPPIVFRRC
jgi:hypothetical protein